MLAALIGGVVLVAGFTLLLVVRRLRRAWFMSGVSDEWLADQVRERHLND
jgi:hypothetical protein